MVDTCSKCGIKLFERELELSHDIPRYMGGTDKDGRHFLCKDCHKSYELEIIKRSFMSIVGFFPDEWKRICKFCATKVKEEWYGK